MQTVSYANAIIEYNERHKSMIYLNSRRIEKLKKIILFLLTVMLTTYYQLLMRVKDQILWSFIILGMMAITQAITCGYGKMSLLV